MFENKVRALSILAALLCAAFTITACNPDNTGQSTQYVDQPTGSSCTGHEGNFNTCTGTTGTCLIQQYCDPATHAWTACTVQPGSSCAAMTGVCSTNTEIRLCTQAGGMEGEYCCNVGAGMFDMSVCHRLGYCYALSLDGGGADSSADAASDAPADAMDTADVCVSVSCYTGPAGTNGVGTCHGGMTDCTTGACTGQVTPIAEICGDGLDNDCNGVVDNGCGCTAAACGGISGDGCWCDPLCTGFGDCCGNACMVCPVQYGVSSSCYDGPFGTLGVGICRGGTIVCSGGGGFTACSGEVLPATEVCNNLDDDCNGLVDDGVTQACYTGPAGTRMVGACHDGTQTCSMGSFGACTGQTLPTAEICNGIDDNCNGLVDDGLSPIACYTGPAGTQGVGICHGGTEGCSGGMLGMCAGQQLPMTEVCNNLDDNCNGVIDDGIAPIACYTGPAGTNGVGTCHSGTQTCTAGTFGACTGQVVPVTEICCNGLDDNCNGSIDEGCSCMDAGADSGSDAATDAADVPASDGGCGNLSVTLTAATEAMCSGGYTTVVWDNSGTRISSAPGGTCTACINRSVGTFIISTAICGIGWNERDWSPFAGQLASAAGVSSIMLSGVEMSGIARICRDTYSTGGWRIVIPNNAASQALLASGCPYPLP